MTPDSLLQRDPWRFTRRLIGITALGATLVQLILSHDMLTLQCLGLCLAGILLFALQFQQENFQANPFSTLMLLGFGATYFYLPLIFTTFELNLVHNTLIVPVEGFIAILSVFVCLILMQRFCARFSLARGFRHRFSHGVLQPLGFFISPSGMQLWAMGLIGLISFVMSTSATPDDDPGALVKFFEGFRPFAFAPYLLLVPQMIGESSTIKKSATVLIIYTAVLFCFAMATGSRSYAVVGLVTVGCSYWLGIWAGTVRAPRIQFRHVAMVGMGLFLITGPLQVAFTAARAGGSGKGEGRSLSESFADFVDAFTNQDILDSYTNRYALVAQQQGAWTEAYVSNELLRRFANLSFFDNTFSIALTLDENARERLTKSEIQRTLAILPTPVIDFFGLDVDKKIDLHGTMGDLFYSETKSKDTGVGGFKTGSVISSSYNLFGWWSPLMIALVSGCIFILMDCFAINETRALDSGEVKGKLKFSPLGILQSYAIFSILSSTSSVEAFSKLLSVLVRRHIQWLFLYALIFWGTRFLYQISTPAFRKKEIPTTR